MTDLLLLAILLVVVSNRHPMKLAGTVLSIFGWVYIWRLMSADFFSGASFLLILVAGQVALGLIGYFIWKRTAGRHFEPLRFL